MVVREDDAGAAANVDELGVVRFAEAGASAAEDGDD